MHDDSHYELYFKKKDQILNLETRHSFPLIWWWIPFVFATGSTRPWAVGWGYPFFVDFYESGDLLMSISFPLNRACHFSLADKTTSTGFCSLVVLMLGPPVSWVGVNELTTMSVKTFRLSVAGKSAPQNPQHANWSMSWVAWKHFHWQFQSFDLILYCINVNK